MATFRFIHDTVESNGKTIKENNLARGHNIPIGALVEIGGGGDPDYENNGLRLFVCCHGRDCDGTPLYWLTCDYDRICWDNVTPEPLLDRMALKMIGGYSEDSLAVIREPKPPA